MKNLICACAIALLAFQTRADAQNINLSADSVTKLLCKKWEMDYALASGKKVNTPASSLLYFEFSKDATFSITGGKPKINAKGTWEYDPKKGMIFLSIAGKGVKTITSLTNDQFVVLADEQVPAQNDSLKARIYFKVKQE